MEDALNPQLSPNRNYMLVQAMTGFTKNERHSAKLHVVDLTNGEKLFSVNGTNKVFWTPGSLLSWLPGQSEMEKYDIDKKAKVQNIPMNMLLPIEVVESASKLSIKGVKFKDNSFIQV